MENSAHYDEDADSATLVSRFQMFNDYIFMVFVVF